MLYSDIWHTEDWQKCIDLLEKSVTFIMAMESQKVVAFVTVGSTYLSQILSWAWGQEVLRATHIQGKYLWLKKHVEVMSIYVFRIFNSLRNVYIFY
jgi:hypothetical protein